MKHIRWLLVVVLLFASLGYGHHESYKPEIIKVTDGVYVAVNYALANMIAVEGADGLLVVDTTENQIIALELVEKFRALMNNKTLKGIVLTHHHGDHINGAAALIDKYQTVDNQIEVYAHSENVPERSRLVSLFRVDRQFGLQSRNHEHGDGVGPDGPDLISNASLNGINAKPTQTFDTRANYTCAGISFELIHIPGETNDQIAVWLPDKKIIMPGDNIYEAFPNLYAIRGTPPRDVKDWFNSIDTMRYLYAEYIVPSHSRPVIGKENVYSVFTAYRDAIQYIHDQTYRLMEQDYFVDEIVEIVKLPTSLATHPHLIEYYGAVAWSVRHVFTFYLGWFSGDAVDLNPLSNRERSFRIKDLILINSGNPVDKMIVSARTSIDKSRANEITTGLPLLKELQWALEVSDMALSIATTTQHDQAMDMKREALRKIGDAQVSSNGFNYYYTAEYEMNEGVAISPLTGRKRQEQNKDLRYFMESFTRRLNPDKCDEDFTVAVKFNIIIGPRNENSSFGYIVRNCVMEFQTEYLELMGPFHAVATTREEIWRDFLLGKQSISLDEMVRVGLVKLEGSLESLDSFMAVTDPFNFGPKPKPAIPSNASSVVYDVILYVVLLSAAVKLQV